MGQSWTGWKLLILPIRLTVVEKISIMQSEQRWWEIRLWVLFIVAFGWHSLEAMTSGFLPIAMLLHASVKSPLLKKKRQLHNLFRVLIWPISTFWIPCFGVSLPQQFTTVSSEIRLLFVSPSSPIKNETKLQSFYITVPVVDWINFIHGSKWENIEWYFIPL